MAQGQPLATVVSVTGQVFARDAEGRQRPLKAGDGLLEGEIVVTSAGGRVELALADGSPLGVPENQAVQLTADLLDDARTAGSDELLAGDFVDQVIQALNEGGNLDDLEAPAAGVSEGGSSGDGNGFVPLDRISEQVNPAGLQLDLAAATDPASRQAPAIVDQDSGAGSGGAADADGAGGEGPVTVQSQPGGQQVVAGQSQETVAVQNEPAGQVPIPSEDAAPPAAQSVRDPSVPGEGDAPNDDAPDSNSAAAGGDSEEDASAAGPGTPGATGEAVTTVLAGDTGSIDEDGVATGNVLANDTGPHGALFVTGFTIAGVDGSFDAGAVAEIDGVGTLSVEADGSYTFNPEDDWSGAVPQVTYSANTGESTTVDLAVRPTADAPVATVTLGQPVIQTTTIDIGNVTSTSQGFSVTAYKLDGSAGSIGTYRNAAGVNGFGVTEASSGDWRELGHSGAQSESISVVFDAAISSATVQFSWLSPVEHASYVLYDGDDGVIGSGILVGQTDVIDPAFTVTATDGELISRIDFAAPGAGDDYLIHSISYTASVSYPVTITAAPTDVDGSESITELIVSVPADVALSAGIDNGDGTWTLPLTSEGGYTVAVEEGSNAVTVTGLTMTVPSAVSGPVEVSVAATATEGADADVAATSSSTQSMLIGTDDAEFLAGGAGDDMLIGLAGGDVFQWTLADRGSAGEPAIDTIADFDTVENGDKLDLRDLLLGESEENLSSYLHFEKSGDDTVLHISSEGGFAPENTVGGAFESGAEDQQIVLSNVDLIGTATSDQHVVQDLLSQAKLITD